MHTEINDTYDFELKQQLSNLEQLKERDQQANRRLLGIPRLSHDGTIGLEALHELHTSTVVDEQRACASRIPALLGFSLLPRGCSHAALRGRMAPLLGHTVLDWTYDLQAA